jgi:hypothetical protein
MNHSNEILLALDVAQAKQDAMMRSLEMEAGSANSGGGGRQQR